MHFTRSRGQLPNEWLLSVTVALFGGAVVSRPLLIAGLRTLGESPPSVRLQMVAGGASAVAVVSVLTATSRLDHGWWWAPGLLVWAVTLIAAAVCDAAVQRVPTELLWSGGAIAAVLLAVTGLVTRDWAGLALTYAASLAAGALLAFCWRFAGVGFGDVRLATVGGLGLGHTTYWGLATAVFLFAIVTITQAAWTYLRTHDRRARFPYGPALAVSFLVAAVW